MTTESPIYYAHSLLTIKSLDDDLREVRGIASTPEPDRYGDVVEPDGAKFAAEIPLLWQHDHHTPVGHAYLSRAKDGINYVAKLAKVDEPGMLKDILDFAWQSIKARLVRGASIGFRSHEHSLMDTGGLRFISYEVIELSAVTIPANASATIQTVKSLHHASMAHRFARKSAGGGIHLLSAARSDNRLNLIAAPESRDPRRAAVGLLRSRRVHTPETDGDNRHEQELFRAGR